MSILPSAFSLPIAAVLVLATTGAWGASGALDLDRYKVTAIHDLPPRVPASNPAVLNAEEASAVTWNWDRETLFVIGDEGGSIVEVDKAGNLLGSMRFFGVLADPEGITYVGDDRLVVVEERLRNAVLVEYAEGALVTATTANYPRVDLGDPVGNIGIEGISYDPRDGSFVTVKEKLSQEVNRNLIDFVASGANIDPLFDPAGLGLLDLADVQTLATVAAVAGTPVADHLLLLSQESSRILEVDRSGAVLSEFDLGALSTSAEGITVDADGVIYVVDENGLEPRLFVLSPTPVPLPGALWLLGSAWVGVVLARRRVS